MVYHELRSPLGLVATAARSAADDCQDDELRGRCEMIVRAAERMLRTANQVFELNRAAERLDRDWFVPAGVAAGLVADLRGLDVDVRCETAAGAAGAAVFGVREQFEALLHSLVTNALDHSDPGTEVVVRLAEAEGELVVSVTNRVASLKRHKGMGLGTYIARALADRLDARLTVASAEGVYRVELALSSASPS
jgi:signal transduction histidine kinase